MSLKVVEIFCSIQGESSFAGLPFVFIRLAGCNLRCSWCDTVYALERSSGKEMEISQICSDAGSFGIKNICVTGGEPLLQDDTIALLKALVHEDYTVTLETNGTFSIHNVPGEVHCIVDVKCPSSHTDSVFNRQLLNEITSKDEVKFVIANQSDYEFAVDFLKNQLRYFDGKIYFSPVQGQITPLELANWVLSDRIHVRVQPQLHKLIGII